MKFSVVNLGCKVNRVEADSITSALLAAGWEHAEINADVAIVNTCTVTAEADKKTRKEVHRALTRHPQGHILVTGCAAAIDPAVYTALDPRVEVVAKDQVVGRCLEAVGHEYSHAPSVLRIGEDFPTRVGIKVQDGCDNACTFCIVHVARGKAVSLPLGQCVEEVQTYAQVGVREIVLTGIDLGAYNFEGKRLSNLLSELRHVAPETRFRVSSIEPHTIDESFIELLASQDGMVCRHLHVPLQSGSTKILRDMARHYTAEAYLEIVENIRARIPQLSLSTDVIVGFPGETEDDFQQTLQVAHACKFSKMHVFRYSPRSGTPAAQRADQISPEVKAERVERMLGLAKELRHTDAQSRVGTKELVLVEAHGKGMSESYYEVSMPASAKQGSLVSCTLGSFKEDETFSL